MSIHFYKRSKKRLPNKKRPTNRKRLTNKKRGGGNQFFTSDILDAFETNFVNNTYSIMRYDEIKKEYSQGLNEHMDENDKVYFDEYETDNKMLESKLFELCNTHHEKYGVGKTYLTILTNYIFRKDNFDMVMIKKEDDIKAILVTKKNDCKKFGNVHSLYLICSDEKTRANITASKLALQLYVFAVSYKYVVDNNTNIFGMLTLAHGYEHMHGLCLYSKYGFQASSSLYNTNFKETELKYRDHEDFDEYGERKIYDLYPYNNCYRGFSSLPMKFDVKTLYSRYLKQNGETEDPIRSVVNFIHFLETQPKDETCTIVYRGSDENRTEKITKLQQFYAKLSEIKLLIKFIEEENVSLEYLSNKLENSKLYVLNKLSKLIRTSVMSIPQRILYKINKRLHTEEYRNHLFYMLMTNDLSEKEKPVLLETMTSYVEEIQKQIKTLVSNYDENVYNSVVEKMNYLT